MQKMGEGGKKRKIMGLRMGEAGWQSVFKQRYLLVCLSPYINMGIKH